MTNFSNSYVITNRLYPSNTLWDIEPLPGGTMWFYTAPAQYDSEPGDYEPVSATASTTPPPEFLQSLIKDLTSQGSSPQLTIVIHGLSTLFSDTINLLSQLGNGLQQYANYGGLVIAFDWPSYGEVESGIDYASSPYTFPPPNTSGTIRDNINGSNAAFQNLLTMIAGLQANIPGLQVNLICHSEGNYMLMVGMYYLVQSGNTANLGQVLLIAADINNGALQSVPADTLTGQAAAIPANAQRVTVYYSEYDYVLSTSQDIFTDYHNPEYLGRLGLEGPISYQTGALPGNVVGLDCSAVVNEEQALKISFTMTPHMAYFYIPQVLQDMAATLTGVAAGQIPNRVNEGAEDGQQYLMQLDTLQAPARAVRRLGVRAAVRASTPSAARPTP